MTYLVYAIVDDLLSPNPPCRSKHGNCCCEISRRHRITTQMNEDRWAHNVLLVGDEHWNCLRTADDDVAKEVKRLESESKLNFRVASKPGETIERLYDVIRGKLLFAVPPRVQKVVVSVGAKDLLDPQLMTLSQGSLGDVRKNNSAYLTPKATALREMAAYLLNQKKTVVLLLPPIGEDRIEISQQASTGFML